VRFPVYMNGNFTLGGQTRQSAVSWRRIVPVSK
jgi:hypothetical protein